MKDPAFLFYSSDFLSGTMLMSDEEIGQYIKLLCLQHQKGHLKEKDMLNICKRQNEEIFSKFKKDKEGNYYNERLEEEINRRKAYSESRRNNRKKKILEEQKEETYEEDMKNICNSYEEHMGTENENETINKNINNKTKNKQKKFKKPTTEEIQQYCKEKNYKLDAQYFYDYYESNGWKVGKNPMKDWQATIRTWCSRNNGNKKKSAIEEWLNE